MVHRKGKEVKFHSVSYVRMIRRNGRAWKLPFGTSLVGALGGPWSCAAVNSIHAGHAGCRDLSAEGQHIVCIGAELHVVAADPALQLAMLMGAMEGSRDDVADLRDLDLFERASGLAHVVGVDGPVAGEVGWWWRGGRGSWGGVGRRRSEWTVLVGVGDRGRCSNLIVGLAEEIFGSAGVAAKLVVVGALCGADEIECLDDGLLGRGEIAMSLGIDGGDGYLGGGEGRHEGGAREQGEELEWEFHLRSTSKRILRFTRSGICCRQPLIGGLGLDWHASRVGEQASR